MAFSHARRTLASSLLRALSSSSSSVFSTSSVAYRSPLAFATLTKQNPVIPLSLKFSIRSQTSVADESAVDDSSTDFTKPSPEETETTPKDTDSTETKKEKKEEIILAGCDLKHWFITVEFPDPKPSEEEMLNTYVKTIAQFVGSEEEAKKKIYSVSFVTYTGFGAEISQEISAKVKDLPNISWVLPDSYIDVPNKDYGGDLFVDGKVIPRPKYRKQAKDSNPEQQDDKGNENRRPSQSQRPNRNRANRE